MKYIYIEHPSYSDIEYIHNSTENDAGEEIQDCYVRQNIWISENESDRIDADNPNYYFEADYTINRDRNDILRIDTPLESKDSDGLSEPLTHLGHNKDIIAFLIERDEIDPNYHSKDIEIIWI